jgi:hypothetical protein
MVDTPDSLAADMLKAAAGAVAATRAVVQKGALNVKTEGRKNSAASSGTAAAGAPSTITYDTKVGRTSIEAEIGYEKRGQGKLGNLLEYGSRNNPPHRDLGRALDSEEPRFEQAIAEMVDRLL